MAGASFRDLLAGRLAAAPGERATIADWANHLSTLFPEVRLKRYLEMRGADVGPPERIVALSALMIGLYYDADALRSAEALIEGWTAEDRQKLRDEAPLVGLAAEIRGRDLRAIVIDMLGIARGGLKRRARLNARGEDETVHLRPLEAIAESGAGAQMDWPLRGPVGPFGRSGVHGGGVLERDSIRRNRRCARAEAWRPLGMALTAPNRRRRDSARPSAGFVRIMRQSSAPDRFPASAHASSHATVRSSSHVSRIARARFNARRSIYCAPYRGSGEGIFPSSAEAVGNLKSIVHVVGRVICVTAFRHFSE